MEEEFIDVKGMKFPISGYKIINNKKVPIVKCTTKTIKNKDGSQSVVIQAPTVKIKGGQK